MTKLTSCAMLLALGVLLTMPALAQSAASPQTQQDNIGKVHKLQGSIMLSNQAGAFAAAALGQQVVKDQRLMVASNSSTTIVYNDGCRETFDKAGVYTLDESACVAVLWPTGGKIAYAAITGGLIYGIIHNTNDTTPISR